MPEETSLSTEYLVRINSFLGEFEQKNPAFSGLLFKLSNNCPFALPLLYKAIVPSEQIEEDKLLSVIKFLQVFAINRGYYLREKFFPEIVDIIRKQPGIFDLFTNEVLELMKQKAQLDYFCLLNNLHSSLSEDSNIRWLILEKKFPLLSVLQKLPEKKIKGDNYNQQYNLAIIEIYDKAFENSTTTYLEIVEKIKILTKEEISEIRQHLLDDEAAISTLSKIIFNTCFLRGEKPKAYIEETFSSIRKKALQVINEDNNTGDFFSKMQPAKTLQEAMLSGNLEKVKDLVSKGICLWHLNRGLESCYPTDFVKNAEVITYLSQINEKIKALNSAIEKAKRNFDIPDAKKPEFDNICNRYLKMIRLKENINKLPDEFIKQFNSEIKPNYTSKETKTTSQGKNPSSSFKYFRR